MRPLNPRYVKFLKRLVKGDSYALNKYTKNLKSKYDDYVARHIESPKIKKKETRTSLDFVKLKKKYELNYDLFFDKKFYEKQTSIVFDTKQDAIDHFVRNFSERLINPHPLFDVKYYIAQFDSLDNLDPIAHFLSIGVNKNISTTPYFDVDFYAREYPDVATSGQSLMVHYMRYGRGELRRPHALADLNYYISQNAELDWEHIDPLSHYVEVGSLTNERKIHPMLSPGYIKTQAYRLGVPNTVKDPFYIYTHYSKSLGINPCPLFDCQFYQQYLASVEVEPVQENETDLEHFLRLNSQQMPLDCSPMFSSRGYWRLHPDIGEMNPLYHFMRYGMVERRQSSQSRLDFTDKHVQSVLEVDPVILAAHQAADNIWSTIYPNHGHPGFLLVQGILKDCRGFVPDYVFLLSAFRRGGAEKISFKLMETLLSELPDCKILIILTDNAADEASHWCPESPRLRVTRFAHEPELVQKEAIKILGRILELLRPKMVINCNSNVGWQTFRDFGKPLSSVMKLRASLFCYDYDKHGHKVGYARDFLRDTIEYLDLVFVDNECFKNDLIKDFSLALQDAQKINVYYQVQDGQLNAESADNKNHWPDLTKNVNHPKLLWPMRLHRQKRPDILRKIAIAMPEVQFDVWVPGGRWNNELADGGKPSNVFVLPDSAPSFAEIDKSGYIGLLSTSQWEGVPTIILEAAEVGLPLITSVVGGVGEVVSEKTGYPIVHFDQVDDYVEAIRSLIDAPATADIKRIAAAEHISVQHGRQAYVQRLKDLGFVPTSPSKRKKPKLSKLVTAAPEIAVSPATKKPKQNLELKNVVVVVNAHREGNIIAPTLRSVDLAVRFAEENGISCGVCVVVDKGDVRTSAVIKEFSAKNWRIEAIEVGDLGEARNEAVRLNPNAEFLAFIDGDDLFSSNWIRDAYRCAKSWKTEAVWHPSTNYIFGRGDTYAFNHRDMDDHRFKLDFSIVQNYWTALSFAHRETYEKYQYERNTIRDGWGYEDWSWNSKTISEGIVHKIVPNTAHFIRRKNASLLVETNAFHNLARLHPLRNKLLGLDNVEDATEQFEFEEEEVA